MRDINTMRRRARALAAVQQPPNVRCGGFQAAHFLLFTLLPPMERKSHNAESSLLRKAESAPTRTGVLTVSQLTARIKHAIQSTFPSTVHVVGEISNFKRHTSGHIYLTLKDEASELSCVLWRSEAVKLKFAPKDGLEVVASGTVEVFERAGRYQLYIRRLEPRGIGALELAFRQLCEKLQKEGLFEAQRKRALPPYPRRIALVTSPTGAAIADMLRTIERRYPCVEVLVFPVRVQGDGAAAEIAGAIHAVNAHAEALGGIDVMIVGRGGGSLEDLWAFNEEIVARAIHASRIPIVSAVGHEVDVTIADLVADVRAATPTAAAELAVPVLEEVLDGLLSQELRLSRTIRAKLELGGTRLTGLLKREPLRDAMIVVRRREQVLDELTNRAQRSLATRIHGVRRTLDAIEPVIRRIAPHTYLLRTGVILGDAEHALRWAMSRRLAGWTASLAGCDGRLDRASPAHRVQRLGEHVAQLGTSIPAALGHRLTLLTERVRSQETLLAAVSHKNVLARGFSITRLKKGRMILRSVRELKDRQRLVTQLADGEFESETMNINQMELFE